MFHNRDIGRELRQLDFGQINFRGSRDKTMFLVPVLSVGLMKKEFMSI